MNDRSVPAGVIRLTDAARRCSCQPAGMPTALACRTDPDLFFADSPADLARAKALCQHCPARATCLAGALDRGEPCGVWGGELFLNGLVVRHKRPRGRPRKPSLAA